MAERTSIEWADATFNPWTGCTKVSPGCDHCYAEGWSKRAGDKVGKWGPGAPRVRTTPANWRKPVQWNAEPFLTCTRCGWRGTGAELERQDCCKVHHITGARRRVFCASLADVFDNEVPGQWRIELMRLIVDTPNLDWLLLTKRIGNAAGMLETAFRAVHGQRKGWADNVLPNVWLGATIVNQEEADRDIPKLLATPAAVRFLSMEPLLGPVDLTQVDDGAAHRDVPREEWGTVDDEGSPPGLWWNVLTGQRTIMHGGATGEWSRTDAKVDWVIAGGESGHGARPLSILWVRGLRDQCAAAGVPFHFKQWGEWAPAMVQPAGTPGRYAYGDWERGGWGWRMFAETDQYPRQFTSFGARAIVERVGKKAAGRLLDGKTHNGFPRGAA